MFEVHIVTSGNLDTGARTGTFFDSGYLSTGNTFQHIFNDAQTFDYYRTPSVHEEKGNSQISFHYY
jgi:hypothetical protein